MWPREFLLRILCSGLVANAATAAVIGTNQPAQPLTPVRISQLPTNQSALWQSYWEKSRRQGEVDHTFLRDELKRLRLPQPIAPPPARGTQGIALNRDAEWYRSAEARRIAEIIISFQTPAGGWSKNLDLTQHRRAPGEHFAQSNLSRFGTPNDLDQPHDPDWNYVGTFDNGASTTQLRYLAKVIAASPSNHSAALRQSFSRGLEFVLAAQYPNGGWPQVWPLQGGYHDAITYNDGAMTSILDLLMDVSAGNNEFAFVPAQGRQDAARALQKGLGCILATQVTTNGAHTAWSQQYDPMTLAPTAARNYEMPSLSSGESAGIMQFLMRLPTPDSNVVMAVRTAAAWFESVAIRNQEFRRVGDEGRQLVATPGHGPIWARYYEIGSNRPIFGDRDKSIHDTVSEISRERRDGYAWFNTAPAAALKRYAEWNQAHP